MVHKNTATLTHPIWLKVPPAPKCPFPHAYIGPGAPTHTPGGTFMHLVGLHTRGYIFNGYIQSYGLEGGNPPYPSKLQYSNMPISGLNHRQFVAELLKLPRSSQGTPIAPSTRRGALRAPIAP